MSSSEPSSEPSSDSPVNPSVESPTPDGFTGLGLAEPLLAALSEVGYENPSPIQARTIPLILAGKDVLGQAQTGTGKTAAFALPFISRLDLNLKKPQVLVLTPTRELALQVAEAFQKYAARIKGFHVLPVYGGQDYNIQLRQLKRGVHVVVGTPGRVMDHMKRKTLALDSLTGMVLDEADEMLRMGFIDDVEWVLEQIPDEAQIALFSATMPAVIRSIARRHLKKPEEITIKVKTATASTINQRFWPVSGVHKLDALTRILEGEDFDGMLIFVRTKVSTLDLAEKLEARGFSSAPLSGDIPQKQREKTVEALKSGKLDILVATDVAARGLDVDRISHVINYDIPYDTESYIHRIGRTGRAGRKGEAILFVAPRERRLLKSIERATNQKIEMMELPTTAMINDTRIEKFKQRLTDTLAMEELGFFYQILEGYRQEHNVPALEIASALAVLIQGDRPFLLKEKQKGERFRDTHDSRSDKKFDDKSDKHTGTDSPAKKRSSENVPEPGMERFVIEVGRLHGVNPGAIVGAITNEAGLDGEHVGRIDIFHEHSTVDLPEGMPRSILRDLKKVAVAGHPMRITRIEKLPGGWGAAEGGEKSRKSSGGGSKTKRSFAKPGKSARPGKPARPGKAKAGKRKSAEKKRKK